MEDLAQIHDPNRYYGIVRARVDEFISSTEGKFYLREVYEHCGAHDDNAKSAVRIDSKRFLSADLFMGFFPVTQDTLPSYKHSEVYGLGDKLLRKVWAA